VVAVFRSLEGESLEDVSIRLAQAWRVGQKDLDNGVIFLVFLDDRKMRLEVGYGLEGTLTDATAASIIREVVAPRFREGRLADGLDAGLDAIERAIAGAYGPAEPVARPGAPDVRAYAIPLLVLLVLGFVVFTSIQSQRLSRRRGWTGGRGGWVAGSPGFGGSSWSGGHSSGGAASSDSFSGGGGSFGGGGASGEW
jgi:uncharacterized protein